MESGATAARRRRGVTLEGVIAVTLLLYLLVSLLAVI